MAKRERDINKGMERMTMQDENIFNLKEENKELKKKIKELEKKNEELEKQNKELIERIKAFSDFNTRGIASYFHNENLQIKQELKQFEMREKAYLAEISLMRTELNITKVETETYLAKLTESKEKLERQKQELIYKHEEIENLRKTIARKEEQTKEENILKKIWN